MQCRSLHMTVAALIVASACGPGPTGRYQYLPVPVGSAPPPGRCRVVGDGVLGRSARDCDGIEWLTEFGDIVLYRPQDRTRQVVVCYMSLHDRGVIDAVEVYSLDNRKIIEVVQRHGEPPPEGGCQNALWGWLRR
jgi:hypothetical protein